MANAATKHTTGKTKVTTTTTTVTTTVEEATDAGTVAPSKTIHVTLLIDASGSMQPRIDDTLGGFETFIGGLKADTENDYRVTVTTFDTQVRVLFSGVALAELPALTKENYHCVGNTALLDAVGATMREVTGAVKIHGRRYGVDRVLFVILTDGEENSSRKFTREKVAAMIKRREASGNWTFAYIGSEASTWQDAQAIGIARGSTLRYTPGDVRGAFASLTASATSYSASGTASSTSFFTPPVTTIDVEMDDAEPALPDTQEPALS